MIATFNYFFFEKNLHLPPYLTTRAPRALKKNTNHVRKMLTKFGPDRAELNLFQAVFRFDMFFAELTSLGANYSTLMVGFFKSN